ncbi:MAG: response regulator [Myxococcota bacterium]
MSVRPAVLLVDDEPANLVALEVSLASLDAELVFARSGAEALERLFGRDYALIVLDVRMPIMDGFETAEIIRTRERSARTPILFVTGHDPGGEASFRGYEVGAVDYVTKPYDPRTLRSKVAVFLDLWRTTQEVRRQAELLRQAEAREHARQLAEAQTAERARAEADRRRTEAQMARVLDAVPLAVYSATGDGLLATSISPNVERITGFPPSAFLGSTGFWSSRIHPDDRERALATLTRGAEGDGWRMEYRWQCADGSWRWFLDQAAVARDAVGRTTEILGTFQDVHAEKQAEVQLREAHEELQASLRERVLEEERLLVTLRCIADGVLAADTAGRVRQVNRVAEEWTGWRQEDAVGKPLGSVFTLHDEETGEPRRLDGGPTEGVGLLQAKDGAERIVAYRAAPIAPGDGEALGLVLVFRDITEKRRHEEEMLKASKLESLGVLAGGIAHDFNNLLTGITASVSLAIVLEQRGRPVRERLATAQSACDRARRLTQQLLTFARGGSPVKQRIDVATVVREAAAFALQGSRSRLEIDVQPGVRAMEADPGQIAQVLHNLVINADQAMPEGGVVRVRVANRCERQVEVSVSDTGQGVPSEIRTRIFDPFFTTKPKGTGLGLATVYSIVQRHGGVIELRSRPGEGATFTVVLPAEAEAIVPAPQPPRREVRGGVGRVLVMDDEPHIREVASEALSLLGYHVATFPDGETAVRAYGDALRSGTPFDAVIMDLTVPGGMGGRDAIRHIRSLDPAARALVSSGYSTDPVVANPREYGFDGVIAKPWTLDDLDATLRRLLPGPRAR